jgi:hypothetical protein
VPMHDVDVTLLFRLADPNVGESIPDSDGPKTVCCISLLSRMDALVENTLVLPRGLKIPSHFLLPELPHPAYVYSQALIYAATLGTV